MKDLKYLEKEDNYDNRIVSAVYVDKYDVYEVYMYDKDEKYEIYVEDTL